MTRSRFTRTRYRASFLTLATLVLSACGTRTVVHTVTVERPSGGADQQFYGHVVSVQRSGSGYVLRFDPEWMLVGITANVAAAEDTGVQCAPSACAPVPNDAYRVDERNRPFTFKLPSSTRGTVLIGGPAQTKTIAPSELAAIVAGHSPLKLFEPLESGVWIGGHVDTVRRFAQQYRP